MKRISKIVVAVFGMLIASLASAQVTYTYTGNQFLYIGGCCGVSKVSGSFTVGAALAANTTFSNLASVITTYDFTDGRTVWTPSNTPSIATSPFNMLNEFDVTTGANGDIASWQINIVSNNPDALLTTQSSAFAGTGGLLDGTNVYNNYDAYSYAPGNSNGEKGISGTWTVSAPVPEPESCAMLLAGLSLMGFVARRRG